MRRSARLRSVMLRATKMLPWNCGSSLSMREPANDTGMVCPERVRTTVSRVSCAACSRSKSARSRSSSTARMLLAEQLLLGVAEQLAGGGVGHLDDAVRRGDEHRVRHAVEHAVQVALVDGRDAQAAAHALERLLQVAERVALARHLERARVVALADALGALDERVDRALQLAHRAPRQRRAEQRAGGGEGERQPQRQAGARGGGGVQPPGEARLRHRRCLHQRHA